MERAIDNEREALETEVAADNAASEATWWQFWDLPGEERSRGPGEWSEGLVEVCSNADWTTLTLLRNGEPLRLRQEKIGGDLRVVAPWPRSGPGHYRLRLLGEASPRETRLSIWPEKISRSEHEELLHDLEQRLPAQIAIALRSAGGLAGIELNHPNETTLEQELIRLRRAAEGTPERIGLAAALKRLAEAPHRILTAEERWVRRGRARRPRADRLGMALARPGNVEEDRLKRVADRRTHHTADVYENRMLGQYVRQVQLRLRRIEPLLPQEQAQEASKLHERLRQGRRKARFLDEVSELSRPPTRASMVLQKRPLYRAVFEGYLEFQKSLAVTLDAPALDAPLRNLPLLYQLWCTLHVIDVAVREARDAGFEIERSGLFHREGGFLKLRLASQVARFVHPETGAVVQIRSERTYSARSDEALHSISYRQRPDIAIEVTAPSGKQSVYLFDPKYKLNAEQSGYDKETISGEPKKPDVDKMHTYRDAVRGREGRRVVQYAAILYPGASKAFSPGLEAIAARPKQAGIFREQIEDVVRRALLTS